MPEGARCRAEYTAFDLENVACMTWAGHKVGSGKLYIYLVGGRFTALEGRPALLVWNRFAEPAEDVCADAIAAVGLTVRS
jgi:hypothetical protein